jgi:hypothetical protein
VVARAAAEQLERGSLDELFLIGHARIPPVVAVRQWYGDEWQSIGERE